MMPKVPWKWNETKVDAVLESIKDNIKWYCKKI